jgi:iron complex transport system ATP-binding protein
MNEQAVEARDLSLARNGHAVLDAVTLNVGAGAIVGVIGPNGAGKSTLLKVIAGVEHGWRGAVRVMGRDARAWSRLDYARQVAYLPQEFHCHWPMTVEELVMLGASRGRGFGWPTARAHWSVPALDWAFAALGIEPLRRRVFNTLSSGEKARARLAAVVASRPRVVLADEPIANLDPYHQIEAIEQLRMLAKDGAAIVIVVHDLTIAARFCDRLILLDGGRVARAGDAASVLDPTGLATVYRVSAVFGAHQGERYVIPWTKLPFTSTAISEPPP